jgi:hypothetical protein
MSRAAQRDLVPEVTEEKARSPADGLVHRGRPSPRCLRVHRNPLEALEAATDRSRATGVLG